MARKKKEQDPVEAKLYAQLEAMQRAREERIKEEARQRELLANLPDYIKVGTKLIMTATESKLYIANIDPSKADGIILKKTAPQGWEDMEYEYSPTDFQRSVERGIIIARGYTPPLLKFGYRFTEIDYDKDEIVVKDKPNDRDKRMYDNYTRLKPYWS